MVSEERRKVRWMEKGFTDKIEGVKSLALLAKERGKNDPMMDALECCKQHDGPVTAKDLEKLKSFTESQIIAEIVFSEEGNGTEHQTETQS